jgi:DNA polymerase
VTERETPRELLARYLRQRAELGEREWFLERTSADRLLKTLRDPKGPAPEEAQELPSTSEATDDDAFLSLKSDVLACTRCRLSEGRRTVVFGEGDRHADLMVVGEAPGGEEDRTGRPFVGPAGKLLDKMLGAIDFARGEVFICNVLKCRPPGNRDPMADEVASCNPYLRQQVELIEPKAICAFGRFAAQTLLSSEASLGRMRGAAHEFMGIPVVVTYHPAALLRNAQWKRPAWEDLQLLRRLYDEAGGRTPGGKRG